LAWGENSAEFGSRIASEDMQKQFIILNPVGKKRLIDYYRSCDVVLDHFVYGYFGATALEAASIGKPVVMKLRQEHYAPFYKGDVMPVFNAATPWEMGDALLRLCDSGSLRLETGAEMRRWLVRNHAEEKTVPLMLALLRLSADQVPLPKELVNPLWDEETEEQKKYHETCFQPVP
jgi:glycosyltransferase involved in cell wall biosynthesis